MRKLVRRSECYYDRTKAVAKGTIDENIVSTHRHESGKWMPEMNSDLINAFAEFCVRYGMSRSKDIMLSELYRAEN